MRGFLDAGPVFGGLGLRFGGSELGGSVVLRFFERGCSLGLLVGKLLLGCFFSVVLLFRDQSGGLLGGLFVA